MDLKETLSYGGITWTSKTWNVGETIDEIKLNNIDKGLRILATAYSIIAAEIGSENIQGIESNSTRIDRLMSEVWGSENPATLASSRIDKIDTIVSEVWGTSNTSSSSIIDDLVKEIGGTRSAGNGFTSSRVDTLETTVSDHTASIGSMETELGKGSDGFTRLSNIESRLSTSESKLSTIIAEIWNGTDLSVPSRIDSALTFIGVLNTEVWGSNVQIGTSRIDTLEASATQFQSNFDALFTEVWGTSNPDTTANSRIDNFILKLNHIFGDIWPNVDPDTTPLPSYTTSRIDVIEQEIWGALSTSQGSRIDSIETRLNSLESEIWDGLSDSRVDILEAKVSNLATNLFGSDVSTGNSRLDQIITEVYGTTSTAGTSRIDNMETILGGQTIDGSYSLVNFKSAQDKIARLETIVGLHGTYPPVDDHEARLNTIESTIASIVSGNAPPIVSQISNDMTASDVVNITTAIVDNGIGFIVLNEPTIGENNLVVKFDGTNYPVHLSANVQCKAQFPAGTVLGLYRKGPDFLLFNMPAIL